MSEREGGSGFGPFLLGVSLGAVLGFLFAPEPGEAARGRLSRKLRGLRDLAADKAAEVGELLEAADAGRDEAPTARAALERRLADAKQRRRGSKRGEGAALPRPRADAEEEDEPVA
jgi:gas vesicle protein